MRFLITARDIPFAWDDPSALEDLDALIRRCEDAGHDVVLCDADLVVNSEWFSKARLRGQERLKALLQASAHYARRDDAIEVSSAEEATAALRLAFKPLVIVVENRLRDGKFIEAAVRLYATSRLRDLVSVPPTPPAVEFLGSGGTGDMPKTVRSLADQANTERVPLRVLVIRDSDLAAKPRDDAGTDPVEPTVASKEIAALRAVVDMTPGARLVVWKKRAAENYLPDSYWIQHRDSLHPKHNIVAVIDTLISKTSDERDYIDMGGIGLKQLPKVGDDRPYHLALFADHVAGIADNTKTIEWRTSVDYRDGVNELTEVLNLIDGMR